MVGGDKFKESWEMGNKYEEFIMKGDGKVSSDGKLLQERKQGYIGIEEMSDLSGEERGGMGMRKVKLGNRSRCRRDRQSCSSDGSCRRV